MEHIEAPTVREVSESQLYQPCWSAIKDAIWRVTFAQFGDERPILHGGGQTDPEHFPAFGGTRLSKTGSELFAWTFLLQRLETS